MGLFSHPGTFLHGSSLQSRSHYLFFLHLALSGTITWNYRQISAPIEAAAQLWSATFLPPQSARLKGGGQINITLNTLQPKIDQMGPVIPEGVFVPLPPSWLAQLGRKRQLYKKYYCYYNKTIRWESKPVMFGSKQDTFLLFQDRLIWCLIRMCLVLMAPKVMKIFQFFFFYFNLLVTLSVVLVYLPPNRLISLVCFHGFVPWKTAWASAFLKGWGWHTCVHCNVVQFRMRLRWANQDCGVK